MIKYSIFTDGSVNQKTKVGAGCYLILNEDELSTFDSEYFRIHLQQNLKYK